MKTESTFLFSFLYNLAADYILLLFLKKDLYPEIKDRAILIGAAFCSLSYILWEETSGKLPAHCRAILKWFLLFIILCILFKIRSVKNIGKTIRLFLCYLFLMGGAVTFFLSCIHVKMIDGRKAAWKAMAVIWFSAGVIFLWKVKKKRENVNQISQAYTYEVRISRKGKKEVYKGIYDSGNRLISQITGQGVCIITKEQAAKLLLPEEKSEIEQFYQQFSKRKTEKKMEKKKEKEQQIEKTLWKTWAKQFQRGIYILQYSSVGKKNAKMPGVMAEEIVVLKDGEVLTKTKGMLGISQEELSGIKEFSVLLPNDIFDREKYSNIL